MKEVNAVITGARWDRTYCLTHWIDLEGEGWACSFGGFCIEGECCSTWINGLMDVLEMNSFNDKALIGTNIRVRFSGDGGIGSSIEGIGHILKNKWMTPRTLFQADGGC